MSEQYQYPSHREYLKDTLNEPESPPVRLSAAQFTRGAFPLTTGKGVRVAVLESGIVEHKSIKTSNVIANLGKAKHSRDVDGHAHIVSGIIAAADLHLLVGLAPEAIMVCAKVTDDAGLATPDSIASGLVWAALTGADIIVVSHEINADQTAIALALEKVIECHCVVVLEKAKGTIPESVIYAPEFPIVSTAITSAYTENRYSTVMSDDFRPAILAGLTAVLMENGHSLKENQRRGIIVKQHLRAIML